MWAHRSGVVLLRHQVISAAWYQVAPPVLLRVMQGEAIPRQAHQFGRHPHLQADEAGARRPAVHRHLLTKLTVPAELHGEMKRVSVTKGETPTRSLLC